ncbi:hypothetical protein SAMN05428967_1540 [Phyllobacterium sp. YR620]|nr:hypothetical protein SAMN05428967_1540 [Phyllobacterium sp. YR620]
MPCPNANMSGKDTRLRSPKPKRLSVTAYGKCDRKKDPRISCLLYPPLTAALKFSKNCVASFFEVDAIRRLPSWAILPPTSALTT